VLGDAAAQYSPRPPELFVVGWILGQLWLFWVAPTIGGLTGGSL